MGGPGVLPSPSGQKEANKLRELTVAWIWVLAGISVETGGAETSHTTAHTVRVCHVYICPKLLAMAHP